MPDSLTSAVEKRRKKRLAAKSNATKQQKITPREAEKRSARQAAKRPAIGIRPMQFGEIDEAAGERVVLEPVDVKKPELGGKAVVRGAGGEFIRNAGNITTPQQIALRQRQPLGAPLSAEAGAMGQKGALGITPETFATRDAGQPRSIRPLPERLKEEEERRSRELQKYKEQLTEQEYRKISKDVEAGSKKRQEEIRQQYDDEYKDWLAQNEELKAKMLSDQMKQEKPQVFTGIDPQIQTQAENMSLKIQSLIDSIEDPDIQSAMQMLAGLTENKETNLATLELMQKQTSLQESQEASESYAEGAAERFNRYLDKAEQVAAISRERNEKYLSQQEAQAKARLDFQEKKAERSLKKAQSRALDARAARLALSGGFGSPGGLAEIDRMDFEYEQALSDLYTEVGLKRADLTIQFSGLYNEVQEQYQVSVLNAMRDHTNAMAALELQSFTNEEALRREQRNTITDFINSVVESRRETVAQQRDLINDITNIIQAENKPKQVDVIKTGDTLKFVSDISKELNGRQIIKDAVQIDTRAKIMERAASEWFAGKTNSAVAVDQALITMFNKMTDPSSVVRESEYLRTSSDLSLFDRIKGIGAKQFITGGAGLTDDVRRDLVRMAKAFKEEYDKKLEQTFQPYIARINMFNSQQNVQTPVALTDVIPSNLIPQISQGTLDMWKQQMGGTSASMGSPLPTPQFVSPEYAPSEGFRTDRHSNPTALQWTPSVERWFKNNGYDVSKGEAWPDDPNSYTLDMNNLDDPVAATIDYIDNYSFYYKNDRRWSHTAMSKESWNALTYQQKAEVVSEMARRELSTGLLANGTNLGVPMEQSSFAMVPSAIAAEPMPKFSSILPNPTAEEIQKISQTPKEQKTTIIQLLAAVRRGQIEKREADEEVARLTGTTAQVGRGLRRGGEFVGQNILRPIGEKVLEQLGDIGGKIFNVERQYAQTTANLASSFFR